MEIKMSDIINILEFRKTKELDKNRIKKNSNKGNLTVNKNKKQIKSDIFVTGEKFENAMNMIREDINTSYRLSETCILNGNTLLSYLFEKGIVNKEDYIAYIKTKDQKLKEKGEIKK
jgi:hypothetical protein